MVRLLLLLLLLFAGFILLTMFVAPYQPELRRWYLENACPHLDKLSTDICAAVKREAAPKRT